METKIFRKPVSRSKLRLFIGKRYFMFKRYIKWVSHYKDYSKQINETKSPYIIFRHETPLIRRLQGVDLNLQYNKINNLNIAAKKINGICINPGEIFSYWRLIGKPTAKKGYKEGLILNPDGTFGSGIGGGLCQLANLIFWMTLHTPMEVVERYRHSHDIFPDSNRTQPFGSGATCVYNYLDLQIYNCTKSQYQLLVYTTKDNLVGEWRSNEPTQFQYKVYEKEHSISSTYWGSYIRNNVIYRQVYCKGNMISDEFLMENHAIMMYSPLLASGKCK